MFAEDVDLDELEDKDPDDEEVVEIIKSTLAPDEYDVYRLWFNADIAEGRINAEAHRRALRAAELTSQPLTPENTAWMAA